MPSSMFFALVLITGNAVAAPHDKEHFRYNQDSADSFAIFDVLDLEGGVGGFLVKDKAMFGVHARLHYAWLAMSAGMTFVSSTKDDPTGAVEADLLGNLFEFHFLAQPLDFQGLMAGVGTGVDLYTLWGINADEVKVAWPMLVDLRWYPMDMLFGVYSQARYYLVTSDGLELGTARDGNESVPVLLSLGVTVKWP